MSVVHNTRGRGMVSNGSLSGRDDMPGLAHTNTGLVVHSKRGERGPSMFQGGRNGDNSDTGNGKTQFGSIGAQRGAFLGVTILIHS